MLVFLHNSPTTVQVQLVDGIIRPSPDRVQEWRKSCLLIRGRRRGSCAEIWDQPSDHGFPGPGQASCAFERVQRGRSRRPAAIPLSEPDDLWRHLQCEPELSVWTSHCHDQRGQGVRTRRRGLCRVGARLDCRCDPSSHHAPKLPGGRGPKPSARHLFADQSIPCTMQLKLVCLASLAWTTGHGGDSVRQLPNDGVPGQVWMVAAMRATPGERAFQVGRDVSWLDGAACAFPGRCNRQVGENISNLESIGDPQL